MLASQQAVQGLHEAMRVCYKILVALRLIIRASQQAVQVSR
jgi:hypothetical protein